MTAPAGSRPAGRFAGKTAVVVGASEGIGLAIAAGLVEGGAHVVLVARREDTLAEAAAKLGPSASGVAGDVADEATAARAVAHAVETHGGLDLLHYNAGTLLPGDIAGQPLDHVDRMLAVNLRGPIAFVREAAPELAKRPGAAVTLTSSATGRLPVPGLGVYGATKAALHYLVSTWAIELAPGDIRVNALCPGGTYTPSMYEAAKAIPGLEEATIATNLVKRMATPEEIARPALTLLDSAESGYVTGAVWDIDGGYQRDRRAG